METAQLKQATDRLTVFNLSTQTVQDVPLEQYLASRADGALLTKALPGNFDPLTGKVIYHKDNNINTAVHQGLRMLDVAAKKHQASLTPGAHSDLAHMLFGLKNSIVVDTEHSPHVVRDALVYYAERTVTLNVDLANNIFGAALNLDTALAIRGSFQTPEEAAEPTPNLLDRILPELDAGVLSIGGTFSEHRQGLARARATEKIEGNLERIRKPFPDLVNELRESMQSALFTKQQQLSVATEAEDVRRLTAEVTALNHNLEFAGTFLEEGADYDNYKKIAQRLTESVQIEVEATHAQAGELQDHEIDQAATKFQAINSLVAQFSEAGRQRKNARTFIYGQSDAPGSGIVEEAAFMKSKFLSEHVDADRIVLMSSMTGDKLGEWTQQLLADAGIDLGNRKAVLELLSDYLWKTVVTEGEGDRSDSFLQERVGNELSYIEMLLDELGAEDERLNLPHTESTDTSFSDFLSFGYVTSVDETDLDDKKANVMRDLVPALEEKLGVSMRNRYNQIMYEISHDVDAGDLIRVEQIKQEQYLLGEQNNKLNHLVDHIARLEGHTLRGADKLHYLETNSAGIVDTLLADYEIAQMGNDEHLNAAAVLEDIGEARLLGRPMTLQMIRCLRWCYPNRELQFSPHAGDFQTFGPQGEPIIRRESTERKKLEIWNNTVIKPLQHHNVPVGLIRLLTTGDMELIGGGYDLQPDDQRCVDARAYVDDVRERIPDWKVFDPAIPVEVIAMRDYIARWNSEREQGTPAYEEIWSGVRERYDALFNDYQLNYLGYTGSSLERVLDTEHAHRQPFVSWWSRERTRAFTRHFTTFTIALGALVSSQKEPQLMTVSGNQYAARPFGFGHAIMPEYGALGITLYKSVNDGTQSKLYQSMTEVIT